MKNIAVILSGCGFLDGSEIRESVLTLLALDKHANVRVQCLSLDQDTYHVVNHLTGDVESGKRNMLVESARIARGKIKDLTSVRADDFDAVIMPGGYGVAKNLSTFAFEGNAGSVNPTVAHFLKRMHELKKPIGAICIAPAIIAQLFGKDKVEITLGMDAGVATNIEKTGAVHRPVDTTGIVVDKQNRIVSTPAYMFDNGRLHEIARGIEKCVNEVIALTREN